MGEIDLVSALQKISSDTYDEALGCAKTYGLRFISGDGFREYYNVRKNVKEPRHQEKKNSDNRGKSNKKMFGLVPVYDEDRKVFRDIKYANILAFRDYKSDKWIRVILN